MVKVAIAGATGDVAKEVIDALVARNRHEILLLSRKDNPAQNLSPGLTWVKANYDDVAQLTEALRGVDTVLSFVTVQTDEKNVAQRNLIDAAVRAGVKRFAPSEWSTSGFEHFPSYAGKAEIRGYLRELNKDKKVLEYTLFQPGLFLNYFAHPYPTAKHLHSLELQINFQDRHAIVVEGGDDARITLTTVQDTANIVARAVEFEGEWPVVGGIKGCEISIGELIRLGEKVRGGPFTLEKLKTEDLKAGVIESHPYC